jgi:predicted aspartyl protease
MKSRDRYGAGAMHSSSRETVYSRTRLRVLVILLGLGAAEFCLPAAKAGTPLNLDVLARDGYGMVRIQRPLPNSLVVRGNINGRDAKLVLDTGWGADGISLDSGFAKQLGLSTQEVKGHGMSVSGARMDVRKGMAGLVVLGNVQITGLPLSVGTFGVLRNEHERQSIGASGFVGPAFLHTNSAIVDLQNLRLYLRPPGKGRRAQLGPALKGVGLSEVPFMWDGQSRHIFVDAEINGVTGKMVIDTGAYLTLVDTRFALQMKDNGYASNLSMIDAAGVANQVRRTRARSFKIGGIDVHPPDITLSPGSFYTTSGGKVIGLLGMDVLGQNWGIIDFGQQKLYFASAK